MINIFRIGIVLLISMPSSSMGQLQTQALADLKSLLYSEKEWVKVHVAEFLLWEGYYKHEVLAEFLKEEQRFGEMPKYRIGIWRVLVQAATDDQGRQCWVNKIVEAYNNPTGEDRLHAIETLAKLRVDVIDEPVSGLEGSMRLYTLWNYALGSKQLEEEVKAMLIGDLINDRMTELEMRVTSYILRYIGPLSGQELRRISSWMDAKDLNPSLRCSLLATLLIYPIDQEASRVDDLKSELIPFRNNMEALNHLMIALASKGTDKDRNMIRDLFYEMRNTENSGYNSDLHATAAYMVVKVPMEL